MIPFQVPSFVNILDFIGTFAFAISGIRLASAKRFDWFGAYVVGLATAIGGGTIRDVLLDVTPAWMTTPVYLICTAIAMFFVIAFGKYVIRLNNTFFIFFTKCFKFLINNILIKFTDNSIPTHSICRNIC